jgi:diguanylate cyclase (GGDEF)-like protein
MDRTPFPPSRTPLPRARLLVVDDEAACRERLVSALWGEHDVAEAPNGATALAMCEQLHPDLVVVDAEMPGMDGLELCRRLKRHAATAEIPVLFVHSRPDPEQETAALEAGGVDFVVKPVNPVVARLRVRTHLTLKRQSDLLRELAFVDGLTGVANRRRLDEALAAEWRRGRRAGAPLALLMIDLDHFKRFNDHYGHQAGDACLQTVASVLAAGLHRPYDLAARYGGEEFACLLPETDAAGACAMAEELRRQVWALAVPHADSPTAPAVTISVGVAAMVPDEHGSPHELVARADRALYEAKAAGRNRVCAARPAAERPA